MSIECDTTETLIEPNTIKSDDVLDLSDVKITEPCTPVIRPSSVEFKGSLVVTCCPCPEPKQCDNSETKCECEECKCEDCHCEKTPPKISYLEKWLTCFYRSNVPTSDTTK